MFRFHTAAARALPEALASSPAHACLDRQPALARWAQVATALCALTLSACGGGGGSGDAASTPPGNAGPAATETALSAVAAVGDQLFHDPSLSASGRQACASCHVPSNGHAPDNALAVQLGGLLGDQQGGRLTPSIRYLEGAVPFFFDTDGTPTGGLFWDGRAATLQAQASEPLLDAHEMANADKAALVARLAKASYVEQFRAAFGADALSDPETALARITLALQQYQREDAEFHPYTSKYDDFLRGTVSLSSQEQRGLALFNSPTKGNCAGCHPSGRGSDGALPLFTDFTYDNLGVPRNTEIAANADPAYFDLGLCARPDGSLAARKDLCGAFKVPSLRNVAVRKAYFHNGRFKTLKEALTFYVQRDTNPEKWYPVNADGSVAKFDDLPPEYRANVNTTEVPYNRKPGEQPALSDAEIDDLIAFLNTLTDAPAAR